MEASLLHTAMTICNPALVEEAALSIGRTGVINRSHNSAPADVFPTMDGWVVTQIVGQPLFRRLCKLLEAEEWLDDIRFRTDSDRVRNFEPLNARLKEWMLTRTTQEVLAQMEAARLPCGPVLSPRQILDDPGLQEASVWKQVEYPTLHRPVPVADFPVRMSASPGVIRGRAPQVGEHTSEVLNELGYEADEISSLRGSSVV